MKTNALRPGKDGAVLLTTVVILSVLTLMAVSYLFLLKDNNYFVARDQGWNRALVISEAGIEEGMAHINSPGVSSATPNYGADSWRTSGTNYLAPAVRTNLYGGSYNVLVFGNNSNATITSTGMVTAALSGDTLRRTIQVTATRESVFRVAIVSLLGVTNKGNNITVDSYDSSDTNNFPGGLWNAAHRRAHGDVATLLDSGTALQVGNANIMGKLHTGPGGTEQQAANALGPQGSVGDVAYVTGGSVGIETPTTNWFADDMNMVFPDVNVPYTNGATTVPSTVSSNVTLSSGTYYLNSDLTIKNGGILSIAPFQFVKLYVTGSLTMKGQNTNQSLINVPFGSELIMFLGGTNGTATTATFTSVNNGGNANSFQFYGLPNCTSLSWSGNASYIGTIYAPEASFSLGGGGSTNSDFQGACVVQSVGMNGHFNVHYDENLARGTNALVFIPTSWRELTSR